MNINGRKVYFKVDSGPDVTELSNRSCEDLNRLKKFKSTSVKLHGPGRNRLHTYGKLNVEACYKGKQEKIKMYVVKTKKKLLGRLDLEKLNIVKWIQDEMQIQHNTNRINALVKEEICHSDYEYLKEKYKEVFNDLGKLKDFKFDIKLKENAQPYSVNVPRRVPLPLLEEVRKELNKMVKNKVIKKIDELADWCFPMVVAKKDNGNIRISADYTGFNIQLKREMYTMPLVEETLGQLKGV